jgi:hypothetical protein
VSRSKHPSCAGRRAQRWWRIAGRARFHTRIVAVVQVWRRACHCDCFMLPIRLTLSTRTALLHCYAAVVAPSSLIFHAFSVSWSPLASSLIATHCGAGPAWQSIGFRLAVVAAATATAAAAAAAATAAAAAAGCPFKPGDTHGHSRLRPAAHVHQLAASRRRFPHMQPRPTARPQQGAYIHDEWLHCRSNHSRLWQRHRTACCRDQHAGHRRAAGCCRPQSSCCSTAPTRLWHHLCEPLCQPAAAPLLAPGGARSGGLQCNRTTAATVAAAPTVPPPTPVLAAARRKLTSLGLCCAARCHYGC